MGIAALSAGTLICPKSRGWHPPLAWVLMGNHNHLLIETPLANLVADMAWLQSPYTRRFDSRHGPWGCLFGDRSKYVLIASGRRDETGGDSYLQTLLDYIHLNPVRAGLVPTDSFPGLMDYSWSSPAQAYAVAVVSHCRSKPWQVPIQVAEPVTKSEPRQPVRPKSEIVSRPGFRGLDVTERRPWCGSLMSASGSSIDSTS